MSDIKTKGIMMTSDERSESPKRGERCDIGGCKEKPTSQCPRCGNWYCYNHAQTHKHKVSEKEMEEERRRNEELR